MERMYDKPLIMLSIVSQFFCKTFKMVVISLMRQQINLFWRTVAHMTRILSHIVLWMKQNKNLKSTNVLLTHFREDPCLQVLVVDVFYKNTKQIYVYSPSLYKHYSSFFLVNTPDDTRENLCTDTTVRAFFSF